MPNRVWHFIWRAVRDSLPTKRNLKHRHAVGDDFCPLCDDTQETILHSLWYCEQAQAVWRSERSFEPLYEKKHRTFMELFEAVSMLSSSFHIAWFAIIAWCLWQRRNRLREHQLAWPLLEVGQRARVLVAKFFDAQQQ